MRHFRHFRQACPNAIHTVHVTECFSDVCAGEDKERFVREQASDLLPAIESCSYTIQRLDIIRWLYLRRFGGVYADLDMECLLSLDSVLGEASFVTGEEPAAHAQRFDRARLITNAFMASVPDHPFVNDVLGAVQARALGACVTHEDVLASTGPIFVTDVFDRKPSADVVVWPEDRLSPDDAEGVPSRLAVRSIQHGWIPQDLDRTALSLATIPWR